ncbi:MAG: nucleotidyl transferase AbiEii/AbiGii toxin family protein [Acidimicrobiales bacterium]
MAKIVLETLESDGFNLAGGSALVASGITKRPTRDIDAFTDRDINIAEAGRKAARVLEAAGFHVEFVRNDPEFVRLEVTAPGRRRSQVSVELGRDHIKWPTTRTSLGPTLSDRELAANKALALFGRVQPRDLADLADIASQCDINSVLIDAAAKEAGFDRAVMAEMIGLVLIRPDPEWSEGTDIESTRTFGRRLIAQLTATEA